MPTEVIATAATAANSSDIVVADGETVTLALKGVVDGEARVRILLKDDDGTYSDVSQLTSQSPATVIAAPGTYRATRVAGGTCGVFSG
jgi:hypothetical protein